MFHCSYRSVFNETCCVSEFYPPVIALPELLLVLTITQYNLDISHQVKKSTEHICPWNPSARSLVHRFCSFVLTKLTVHQNSFLYQNCYRYQVTMSKSYRSVWSHQTTKYFILLLCTEYICDTLFSICSISQITNWALIIHTKRTWRTPQIFYRFWDSLPKFLTFSSIG